MGKLFLHAYGDKFYIRLDSQVRNLGGIIFLPNTSLKYIRPLGIYIFIVCLIWSLLLVIPYVVL